MLLSTVHGSLSSYLTGFEIWVLAGRNGQRKQATNLFYSRAIVLLWVWKDALSANYAPTMFWWLMETCLGDMNMNLCIICLDYIVIYSKDPSSHLMRLAAMLQKLENAGLNLKPSKCEFLKGDHLPGPHCLHPGNSNWPEEDQSYWEVAHSYHHHWGEEFPRFQWLPLPVHTKIWPDSLALAQVNSQQEWKQ